MSMDSAEDFNLNSLQATISLYSSSGPIKSYKLEEKYNVTGSVIRDAVRELRRRGVPIANSKDGYYRAKTFGEIEPTIVDLEGRAKSLLETAEKLKSCFSGQLGLSFE